MTDPEERELPTLEDELLGPKSADSPGRGVRAEPRIRLPRTMPWSPEQLPGRRDLWSAGAGFGTFLLVDGVMMYAPLMGRGSSTVLPQMVTLLVLAFGLGSLLVWNVRGVWRPYGLGMMAAWVFLTLISAGFLTGVIA